MDARELLRAVSDAYRNLQSLAVEAVLTAESGDENANQRSEQRVRFLYDAPNRVRYEPLGGRGTVQISDGDRLRVTFPRHRGISDSPRYHSTPVTEAHQLPCFFRSEFASNHTGTFLFQGIDQRVTAAEILRIEDGCYVLSVAYEPSPHRIIVPGPPVLFWVNEKTHMIVRQQAETGHRFPTEDEVTWTRHTTTARTMRINEPLAADAFHFEPPEDAVEETAACGVRVSAGGGFAEQRPDGQRIEQRSSHGWEGSTLVERTDWEIRETKFRFERRLTFSEDGKELHVADRVIGPKGQLENRYDVPVS